MASKPTRKTRRYPAKHKAFLDQNRYLYDRILAWQGGHCALCPTTPSPKRRLDLDHDHDRMVIRGLLCYRHNRGLSFFRSKEELLKAAEYVGREITDQSLTHGSVRGTTDPSE